MPTHSRSVRTSVSSTQKLDYRSNTPCVRAGAARGKMSARSSVRRRYETNCRFHVAAGRLEFCMVYTGSISTYESPGKCAPVPEGGQEAAKDVKEGKQESREGATEGEQESEPSLSVAAFRASAGLGFRACGSLSKSSMGPSALSADSSQIHSDRQHIRLIPNALL